MNIKLTDNFTYLNHILEEDKAFDDSPVYDDIKIMNSLVREFEDSLLQRNQSVNKEYFRFILEVLTKALYDYIFKDNAPFFDSAPMLNSEEIKRTVEEKYKERVGNANKAMKGYVTYSIGDFLTALKNEEHITSDEYNTLLEFKKKANNFVHFINLNYTDIQKPLNPRIINGKAVCLDISYKDSVETLKELHEVLLIVFSATFSNFEPDDWEFDETAYEDGSRAFESLFKRDELIATLNNDCEICKYNNNQLIGKIVRPGETFFEFGAYLECSNKEECGAIMSSSLNLKERKGLLCPDCNNKDAEYKKTASYDPEDPTYKQVIMRCNECKKVF